MKLGRAQQYGMELKYCERCGTLGLRRGGSSQVYCSECEEAMSQVYRAPLHKRRAKQDREEGCGPAAQVQVSGDECGRLL